MKNNRIEYIDSAKAIGILLMILGHCYYLDNVPGLGRIIYSFHMPLFFIISGMFIKPLCMSEAVKKYSKAYLVPYLMACGLMLVLTIILNADCVDNLKASTIIACKSYVFGSGSIQGTGYFHDFPKVGMIWFLLALFWGCMLYSSIKKYTKEDVEIVLWSFLFFFVGFSSGDYIRLPFSLQAGMCSVIFIMIGNVIKERGVVEKMMQLKWTLKSFILLFWICSVVLYGGVNMACNIYNVGIIQIPASIIATLLVLIICYKHSFKLSYIGKNTLYFLIGHQLFKSYNWQTDNSLYIYKLATFTPPHSACI